MDGLKVKRKNNIYREITIPYIFNIYKQVKSNTKNKKKLYIFDSYLGINIVDIYNTLKNKNYKQNSYNIFMIKEPKYRIVMSQNIKDKVINHVMGNLLIKALEPSLISTNIATRKGKGTHYGIKYLKKYLNELKQKELYALKFDISKYFYSINHNILKKRLSKKIKDKTFLHMLFGIIDSTDYNVNKEIKLLKEKEIQSLKNNKQKIFEVQRIPLYKKGYGLPIGNLTSQIMAIYYLNDLDHFIKENLKVKYIRYMDDGVLLSNDKNYLKYCLVEIKKIINKHDLQLNNKTKIINVNKEGIDFLGFHFYIFNNKLVMKVRNKTKKKYKRKIRLIKNGLIDGKFIIPSYQGHFKWGNCYNLYKFDIIKNTRIIPKEGENKQ